MLGRQLMKSINQDFLKYHEWFDRVRCPGKALGRASVGKLAWVLEHVLPCPLGGKVEQILAN